MSSLTCPAALSELAAIGSVVVKPTEFCTWRLHVSNTVVIFQLPDTVSHDFELASTRVDYISTACCSRP